VLDAEAVAQRRGQPAGARRRADQGERGQLERDHLGPGALTDRDRQAPVLHRGVEGLLQRARQAVDLVHEEDRARLERREQRRDVPLALQGGCGRGHERDLELLGEDLGQRRLAQARRPGEQDVVQGLAAPAGGLHGDRELLLEALLADEVAQAARPQRAVELLLVGQHPRCLHALGLVGVGAADHRRDAFRAAAMSASGVSPVAPRSNSSTSAGA
jgi:hypothetical protein